MGAVVQTRLDEEMKAALESAARQQGKSVSDLVREGIEVIVSRHTGIADLSTNPKYMEGFGLDRSKRGNRR